MSLQIKNLSVVTANKTVVKNVSLEVKPKLISVIMGPNGSGKSSLANALAGHPKYTVTTGKIFLDATDITKFSPEKKAKAGLFLSLQHPPAIPGVSVANFLRLAVGAALGQPQNPQEFYKKLATKLKELNMNIDFARRHVHVGFSGGEKKRLEILQLLMIKPKYAILDEIDSGLDVDALKVVAEGIVAAKKTGTGLLLITHYNRLLKYVKPDLVSVMTDGRIIKTGSAQLALEIEKNGYLSFHHALRGSK
ncbi:MAG: Fe-S cluster assembly ATPase SufC [Candidatus Magasanikbacteria bacterium]|nr:Fe-S cluster assembly ATPase SufC [Candidatus Magasanikbacteria bacterium]